MTGHGDILIRDASDACMGRVTEIYGDEVRTGLASYEEIVPSLDEMLARRFRVLDAGLPYLVAERGGEIVGFSYAGLFHTRAAYRFTVENSIYVAADAQRSGVGELLMRTLIARCTASGFRQMIALVGNSSQSGSIRFHENLGFRLVGDMYATGFKFDQWLDTAYMQLALGPGATTPPQNVSKDTP